MKRKRGEKIIAGAPQNAHEGIFRPFLGGAGATLRDIFTGLEKGPVASSLSRHPVRNLVGCRWQLPEAEGAGFYELTRIDDDLFVIAIDVSYKDPRLETIPGDGLIQFYFKLSGDLTLGVRRREPLRLHRPGLLVYHQPTGIDLKEWTAPSARERGVAINLRPQYLIDQFLSRGSSAPARLWAIAAGRPNEFQFVQLRLSAEMLELANKLLENPHDEPSLRLVFTEGVTLQLLCAVVREFSELTSDPHEAYSETQLRSLEVARNLLQSQFSPIPSIAELARTTGLNQTTLKKGFKAVFGATMYDFSLRCRMRHAMTLLQAGRMSIAGIAKSAGYAHQTSFTTAFRAQYGVSPRKVRPLRAG